MCELESFNRDRTTKIVYYIDAYGDIQAKVMKKNMNNKWIDVGYINVDRIIWCSAYENHMLGVE